MWECFSYYGMRVLLVLFMIQELGYSDGRAFCVYALYTTLVEFGGILGGVAADKLLGFRWAIILGGITITLGHVCMAVPESQPMMYAGLGLIVVGTSLFRTNIAAFVGQFYEENDPRRDAGYTVYYTGMNIGGFLASIFCGIVGEIYGWHAGFGLAAIGMILGNIALYCGRSMLSKTATVSEKKTLSGIFFGIVAVVVGAPLVSLGLFCCDWSTKAVPIVALGVVYYLFRQIKGMKSEEIKEFQRLGIYVLCLVLFYACEEQLGSTLVLFSERHVDRVTVFGTFPATSLVTFNPLTILLVGPFLSAMLRRVHLEPFTKIAMSFCLLGTAFYVLYFGGVLASVRQEVSLGVAVGSIILLSIGELFIGPTIFAAASSTGPRALQGLVMGIVTLGFSMANLCSGLLSNMMVVGEGENPLNVYTGCFGMIGFCACALGALILLCNYRRKVFV
jgi:POT family proton-dependent oligopeptide transporter